MNKKYLPFIFLIAAALFLYWIKSKQRGQKYNPPVNTEQKQDPANFNRNNNRLIYSKHARCRMGCRSIDENEVRDILAHGDINTSKIISSPKGVSYPLEGNTSDGQHVRIVFAPKADGS